MARVSPGPMAAASARASPSAGMGWAAASAQASTLQMRSRGSAVRSVSASNAGRVSASPMNRRAPELARMWRRLVPRAAVLMGTVTAPTQAQPRNTCKNSVRLPHISATRSPGPMPCACKSAPMRCAVASACA